MTPTPAPRDVQKETGTSLLAASTSLTDPGIGKDESVLPSKAQSNHCSEQKASLDPGCEELRRESNSTKYVQFLKSLALHWGSSRGSQLLTPDVIRYLVPRFEFCSTPIKIRILTALLYLKPALREEFKVELSQLLYKAEADRDEWVRKLARLLQPLIATGRMDVKETDTETAYKVLKVLDDEKTNHNVQYRMKAPLESAEMCNPMDPADFGSAARSATAPGVLFPTPPRYQVDEVNFRPGFDFQQLMAEVERIGVQRLRRERAQSDPPQPLQTDASSERCNVVDSNNTGNNIASTATHTPKKRKLRPTPT